eukprot:5032543-Ditylum_brightwellii.AAC.1
MGIPGPGINPSTSGFTKKMVVAHTLIQGIPAGGFYGIAITEDCSNDGLNSSLAFFVEHG